MRARCRRWGRRGDFGVRAYLVNPILLSQPFLREKIGHQVLPFLRQSQILSPFEILSYYQLSKTIFTNRYIIFQYEQYFEKLLRMLL